MSRTGFVLVLLFSFALSACQGQRDNSSIDLERARNMASATGQMLLNNKWCAYFDSTSEFHGFVRLTFLSNDWVNIESYAEAGGLPFGKQDDDRKALWKIERQTLSLRINESEIRKLPISFYEENDATLMKLEDTPMWVCNGSIQDPIPIEVEAEDLEPGLEIPGPDEL